MAKKYIDAEKLIAVLEQRKKQLARWTDKDYANQRIDEIDCILDVDIDSLPQEQPEVDLEAFRREVAKDILAGFAAKIGHTMSDYSEQCCKYAIQLADELIKQLKEKK